MARIRTIKPEFPQSESMGRVSRDARLCFIMLWTISDDAGRLRGNSRMLASLLFPYDDDAKKLIERWLAELESERCIRRYEIDGDSYLQINEWSKHQKIDKPSPSKIAPPPANSPNPRELSRAPSKTLEGSSGDQGMDQGEEGITPSAPLRAVPSVKPPALGFDEAWGFYPKRPGNSKADALKAWNARVKEKHDPVAMLEGVKRYADYCAALHVEPKFVKQAATFFGPGLHFQDEWVVASTPGGLTVAASETVEQYKDRVARERAAEQGRASAPPLELLAQARRSIKTGAGA